MKEPNPNKYKNPQNYMNAMKAYWEVHGGPSNQNRALALRLSMWFEKNHEKKKDIARNMKNLRQEFKSEVAIVFPNSNNNNSNKSENEGFLPSNRSIQTAQRILKNLSKMNNEQYKLRTKLQTIASIIAPAKQVLKYNYVRNTMIPKFKAQIRRRNSERAVKQLREKIKLPNNVMNRILSFANIPDHTKLKKTGKKVKSYYGGLTNIPTIYKDNKDTFWFQNKHGRWYRMTGPMQRWNYSNMSKSWIPQEKS